MTAKDRIAIACITALLLLCGGCSEGGRLSAERYVSEDGERLGASIAEVVAGRLNEPGIPARQREILEDVRRRGAMRPIDYENSWAQYKQCMLARGYREIKLQKYPNGLYSEAMHIEGNAEQERRYETDREQCLTEHVRYVDEMYALITGNPNLYRNQSEALVDCLHREGLVPAGYDAKQYDRESTSDDEHAYSFDIRDMKARACMASNGRVMAFVGEDAEERLW